MKTYTYELHGRIGEPRWAVEASHENDEAALAWGKRIAESSPLVHASNALMVWGKEGKEYRLVAKIETAVSVTVTDNTRNS